MLPSFPTTSSRGSPLDPPGQERSLSSAAGGSFEELRPRASRSRTSASRARKSAFVCPHPRQTPRAEG
eukprot:15039917-Alexandrium_andersonii.AAC.1